MMLQSAATHPVGGVGVAQRKIRPSVHTCAGRGRNASVEGLLSLLPRKDGHIFDMGAEQEAAISPKSSPITM